MKNLFNDISQDNIEILKNTQVKKKRVLIHSLIPKRNHIVFEFDLNKKEVRKAEFNKPKEISFSDATNGVKIKREIDGKEGCIYVSALNEKNAWRRFMKLF